MTIQHYEARPPTARAVQFDGSNTAEVAELLELEVPDPTTGGPDDPDRAQGQLMVRVDLYGFGPEHASVLVAGDYAVRHDNGSRVILEPDIFAAQLRAVQ